MYFQIIKSNSIKELHCKPRKQKYFNCFQIILLFYFVILFCEGRKVFNFQNSLKFSVDIRIIHALHNGNFIVHFDNKTWNIYDREFKYIQNLKIHKEKFNKMSLLPKQLTKNLSQSQLGIGSTLTYPNLICFYRIYQKQIIRCKQVQKFNKFIIIKNNIIWYENNGIIYQLQLFQTGHISQKQLYKFYKNISFVQFRNLPINSLENTTRQMLVLYQNGERINYPYFPQSMQAKQLNSNLNFPCFFSPINNGQFYIIQTNTSKLELYNSETSQLIILSNYSQYINSVIQDHSTTPITVNLIFEKKIMKLDKFNNSIYIINQTINNQIPSNIIPFWNQIGDIYAISNKNSIYKMTQCNNHSIYFPFIGCLNYSCQNQNCQTCSFSRYYCQICQEGYNIENNKCVRNIEFINIFTSIISTINSLPHIRLFFIIITPIFKLLDNYWLYSYHSTQINQSTQFFINKITKINQQKFIPTFINLGNIRSQINLNNINNNSNFILYTSLKFIDKQKSSIYFLNNAQKIFIFNLIFIVFVVFCIKILAICLKKFCRCQINGIDLMILRFCKFLQKKSTIKALIISYVDSNLVYLSYYSFLQLGIYFQFSIIDKVNLMVTIFHLLICIIFVLFQSLLYSKDNKANISINLSKDKQKFFKLNYNFIRLIQNLFNGFIFAIFINQQYYLFIWLVLSKLIYILLTIICKNTFKSIFLFLSVILYYSFGLLFDIGISIGKFINLSKDVRSQFYQISIILIIGLILISILQFINLVIYAIYDQYRLYLYLNKKTQQRNNLIVSKTQVLNEFSKNFQQIHLKNIEQNKINKNKDKLIIQKYQERQSKKFQINHEKVLTHKNTIKMLFSKKIQIVGLQNSNLSSINKRKLRQQSQFYKSLQKKFQFIEQ